MMHYGDSQKARMPHHNDKILYLIVYDDVLIPGIDGCPKHTKGCNGLGCPKTCYCQDRCTWERCTLTEPPHECLRETNSSWQQRIEHWTAKTTGEYRVFLFYI